MIGSRPRNAGLKAMARARARVFHGIEIPFEVDYDPAQ